jgi:hypothetical protein
MEEHVRIAINTVGAPVNDVIVRDARGGDREIIKAVTLSAYEQYAAVMQTHWEGYRHNILTTLGDVKPAEQIVAERMASLWVPCCCTRRERWRTRLRMLASSRWPRVVRASGRR